MGPGGETASLSVTAGVSAVALCAVVAVPDAWRPKADDRALVVVGVEGHGRDAAVLAAAEHEAERRHARLQVVHADAGRSATRALLESAAEADLVVVGRYHRKHVVGATLGHTARGLLRHSPIPVLVVDPRGDHATYPGLPALAATASG
jgi:nucleotide-binding universal stress UspA family protein